MTTRIVLKKKLSYNMYIDINLNLNIYVHKYKRRVIRIIFFYSKEECTSYI